MNIPHGAQQIIETLETHGYEAYIVGGCVRDMLLNELRRDKGLPVREPEDWDITTSATPQEIKKLFRKTVDTGIQHGTVTVLTRDGQYEVTTYRLDGNYEDHRHPDEVLFTPELREDLKRRDFTINAMAYSERDGLIDLFGGKKDLEDGIIRCVGDPMERFNEDALRMLRGIRFAGQLGFSIEPDTFSAIKSLAPTIVHVSAERIRVELTKLLISDSWPDSSAGRQHVGEQQAAEAGQQAAEAGRQNAAEQQMADGRQTAETDELTVGPCKLRLAYDAGLTPYFLPEFDEMMRCEQNNPHHCYNVGDHSLCVVAELNRLIDEHNRAVETEMAEHGLTSSAGQGAKLTSQPIDKKTRTALAFAGLLHDVAKPACKTTDADGIDHFHKHQVQGEIAAGEILRRLKFDNDTISLVKCLVLYHDIRYDYCIDSSPAALTEQSTAESKSAAGSAETRLSPAAGGQPVKGLRAMRRLTGKVGRDRMPLLFLLQRADIYGQSDYKKQEKYDVLDAGESCFAVICESADAVSVAELAITGNDLINEFGYKRGPAIGEELKRLLELVMDDPSLNTRERLYELVKKSL